MSSLLHTPPLPAAALRVEYRQQPLDALLADPRLLAVFGFGIQAAPAHADPRYLHVALPVTGDAVFECWQVDGEVRHGRSGEIAWSEDGQLQFCALNVPDNGDIETAARHAYTQLHAWLARSDYPHPLRIWNYLDAITDGPGDEERYRRFCVGRAQGIGRELAPTDLPAATAIGHPQPTGRFQLYWLAARRYPRQYGPQAPGFARALLPPSAGMPLLVSGTAAVVGHASQHGDSLQQQFEEILANLRSLVDAARAMRPELPMREGPATRLKVYVRDADALPEVEAAGDAGEQLEALMRDRLPGVPHLLLHGHVCRQELAVEIDGVHG